MQVDMNESWQIISFSDITSEISKISTNDFGLYQNQIYCIQNLIAFQVCVDLSCQKNPFLCMSFDCECKRDHLNCEKRNMQQLKQTVINKKKSFQQIKLIVNKGIQNQIKSLANRLYEFGNKILKKVQSIHTNPDFLKIEQIILQKLQAGQSDQLCGAILSQACLGNKIQEEINKYFDKLNKFHGDLNAQKLPDFQFKYESFKKPQNFIKKQKQIKATQNAQIQKIVQKQKQIKQIQKVQISQPLPNIIQKSKQIKATQKVQISQTLKKIIKSHNLKQIKQKLGKNQIYEKLNQQKIKQIKSIHNNLNLSANSYRLQFESIQINFEQIVKSHITTVQFFRCHKIQISIEDLQQLLLNLNLIFPNLKLIQLRGCQFNDGHWKIILDHVEQLKNIEALLLDYNKIQQISESDVQKLSTIKQLKCLCIRGNNKLSDQSKRLLEKFKYNNKKLEIKF